MKIFPVILSVAVLGLSVGAWYYADQQQSVMRAVVNVSGGKDAKQGLGATKKAAEQAFTKASSEAKSAKESAETASYELNGVDKAIERREKAERDRDAQIAYRDGKAEELKATEARYEDAQKRAEVLLETMRTLEDLANVADLSEVVDTFQTIVEQAKEKNEELKNEHEALVTAREAATNKVAGEEAELARLEAQNSEFAANYRKNTHEYTVLSVVPSRNIILFMVPKDSGIVIGDSVPLIVKRGDVTIAKLRVEKISDNQATAKYTLEPGQQISAGDSIIRVRPHGS